VVQFIPVLVALITALLGLFVYYFQKARDRKEDLVKTRRSEYRKWVQALYDTVAADKSEARNEFNKTTNDLFLFGSDCVIRSVGEFKTYMAITSRNDAPRDMKKVGNLLAKVIQDMRNDCFDATRLTVGEIRKLLPIEGTRDDDQP
jgi:hypothetical protein